MTLPTKTFDEQGYTDLGLPTGYTINHEYYDYGNFTINDWKDYSVKFNSYFIYNTSALAVVGAAGVPIVAFFPPAKIGVIGVTVGLTLTNAYFLSQVANANQAAAKVEILEKILAKDPLTLTDAEVHDYLQALEMLDRDFGVGVGDAAEAKIRSNLVSPHCFVVGTPILLPNGENKPIEELKIDDTVLAFDPCSDIVRNALVPRRVTRLFRNITTEWLELSNGLTVTPGHSFLNEFGAFEEIGSIVARSGLIVEASGALLAVTAERVVYSERTRHLYEEAEEFVYASDGGAALAPQIKRGWRTYNFEVEGLHTYIAGGIRVHNDSLSEYEGISALVDKGQDNLASRVAVNAFGVQAGYAALTADLWRNAGGQAVTSSVDHLGAVATALANGNTDEANGHYEALGANLQAAQIAYDAAAKALAALGSDPHLNASLLAALDAAKEKLQAVEDNYKEATRLLGTDSGTGGAASNTSPGASGGEYGIGGYTNYYGGTYPTQEEADHAQDMQQDREDDHADSNPIVLDLTGKGIAITKLSSSAMYYDMTGTGYKEHTAWAGVGNGVLVYDTNNDGKITQKNQIVFTEWDPSAASDMQALRDIFDTNHNGVLDAGDANFAKFKVMVTNADGSTTLKSLADLGIVSINLTPDQTSLELPDGSKINGVTSYTTADGAVHARGVATATFAYDANGHAVSTVKVVNADGSTTIDNKAYNSDGTLASEVKLTTALNGDRTIVSDYNGDGVVDAIQTDKTQTSGLSLPTMSIETLTDSDGSGYILDKTVTTLGYAHSVHIDRYATGGTIIDQTEDDYTEMATGNQIVNIIDKNADGSIKDARKTTVSVDGYTRTTELNLDGTTDSFGNAITNIKKVDAVVLGAGLARTETLDEYHGTSKVLTTSISTDTSGLNTTTALTSGYYGTYQWTQSSVVQGSAQSVVTIKDLSGDLNVLLDEKVTTRSSDGLSITTQLDSHGAKDASGNAVFDLTRTDVTTVDGAGTRTQTIIDANADGSQRDKTQIVKYSDGISRTTTQWVNSGAVSFYTVDQVAKDASGTVTETVSSFTSAGKVLAQSTLVTSADGLTTTQATYAVDYAGDVTKILQDTKVVAVDASGAATVTTTETAANGAFVGETVAKTDVTGLTIVTQKDISGAGTAAAPVFDQTTKDITSVDASGAKTRTVTVLSNNNTLEAKSVTVTSADRQTVTTDTDANGDGTVDIHEAVVKQTDGSHVDTVLHYNPDGTLPEQTVTTTSANGLTVVANHFLDQGNGLASIGKSKDQTILNADGSKREYVQSIAGNNNAISCNIIDTNATGNISTVQNFISNVNAADYITVDAINVTKPGAHEETVTKYSGNSTKISSVKTTISADQLTSTTSSDLNGDGIVDQVHQVQTAYNADGSFVKTTTDTNSATGTLIDKVTTTSDANGLNVWTYTDTNGDGHIETAEARWTMSDGIKMDSILHYAYDGTLLWWSNHYSSADGLTQLDRADINNDGYCDYSDNSVTTLNVDGSRTTKLVHYKGSNNVIAGTTTTTMSANGLITTQLQDLQGTGGVDLKSVDQTTLNADGGTTVTHADYRSDQTTLIDKTVTTSTNHGNLVTTNRDINGDGTLDEIETVVRQANGILADTITDYSSTGTVTGQITKTTSANGMVKTLRQHGLIAGTQFTSAQDELQVDTTTVNADGSTVEVNQDGIAAVNGAYSATPATVTTTTSANGLSKTIQVVSTTQDIGGTAINRTTSDVTTINADGSKTEISTATDNLHSGVKSILTSQTSANGLTLTDKTDIDGNGTIEYQVSHVTNFDNTVVDQFVTNNADGSLVRSETITYSADKRQSWETANTSGIAGAASDHSETTLVNSDGSTTTTIADTGAGQASKGSVTTTIAGNSLTSTNLFDNNGDGVVDETVVNKTLLNANGTTERIRSEYNGSGTASLRNRSDSITSANGLSTVTTIDLNGDGIVDETRSDITTINADASRQQVVSMTYADGTSGSKTTILTSADGHTITTLIDADGNGIAERKDVTTIAANGARKTVSTYYDNNTGGSLLVPTTLQASNSGNIMSGGSFSQTAMYSALSSSIASSSFQSTVTTTPSSMITLVYTSQTSADGRVTIVTDATGYNISTTTLLDHQNGSYVISAGDAANGRKVSHIIDENGVDHISETSWYQAYTTTTYISGGGSTTAYTANGPSYSATLSTSEEARIQSQLSRIYDTIFDRDLIASEKDGWIQYYGKSGLDTSKLINDLLASSEATSKYGSLSNIAFIGQIYRNAFGRAPSLSEVTSLLGQLNAKTMTRAQLVLKVSESAEHIADGNAHMLTNNALNAPGTFTLDHSLDKAQVGQMINRLFDTIYDRAPSTAELSQYVSAYLGGQSLSQIAATLNATSEAASKLPVMYASNSDYVTSTYINVFGRLPNATELANWVGMLNAGTLTRSDFQVAVSESIDHLIAGNGQTRTLDINQSAANAGLSNAAITVESGLSSTLSGDNDVIYATTNDVINISGINDTVNSNNNNLTVLAYDWYAYTYGKITINGSSNAISVTMGYGSYSLIGNNNSINDQYGSSVFSINGLGNIITGNSETINMSANSSLAITGTGDLVAYQSGFGIETLNGFNSSDTMQLSKAAFADWTHLKAAMTQSGADTIIKLDAADTITLKNVTASSLSSAQFSFV